MSKHNNYNNYSKPANNKVEKTEPEVRTENLEDEIPVSETDTEIQEAKEKVEVFVSGNVIDCDFLNVREQASVDANVVCLISKYDEVMINKNESTEDFYKVCTATGIEGYCMKRFIAI